mgnify:CR=1 FL=1
MLIAAEDLERWAAKPEARSAFPELVRRLIAHGGGRLAQSPPLDSVGSASPETGDRP